MDSMANRLWAVAAAVAVAAFIVLKWFAGYGFFSALLLAILVLLLVALVLWILWNNEPDAVAGPDAGAVAPVKAVSGVVRSGATPETKAAAAGGSASISSGSSEGPGLKPKAADSGKAAVTPAKLREEADEAPGGKTAATPSQLAAAGAQTASGKGRGGRPAARGKGEGARRGTRGAAAAGSDPRPAPRREAKAKSATGAAKSTTTTEKPAAGKPTQAAKAGAGTTPASSASAGPDDLKQIKGVGPKLESTLHGLGITTFAQIAGWSAADIAEIEPKLKFSGRIERDGWIEQAKTLAEGGTTAFAAKVKKGDVY
ncbi:hypothetical protein [Frigidibacter sp. ROC022]|uniref:hypothetical protein n=1 Tax=Frigidibacter sp. ROC022 TaxID=2971796 RepID=UPI00215AC16B|nr:hypothetical protein [Frigidibacter sp. ROC022]MCR8723276.1 hypothetical protein [Frigidibacter sp. ROC022]